MMRKMDLCIAGSVVETRNRCQSDRSSVAKAELNLASWRARENQHPCHPDDEAPPPNPFWKALDTPLRKNPPAFAIALYFFGPNARSKVRKTRIQFFYQKIVEIEPLGAAKQRVRGLVVGRRLINKINCPSVLHPKTGTPGRYEMWVLQHFVGHNGRIEVMKHPHDL